MQPVSHWIADDSIPSRWDRVSNGGQWLGVTNNWKKQAIWPLHFVIINQPNGCEFKFYHNGSTTPITGHAFEHSFNTEQPITVYIMGDSNGERYTISSIHAASWHQNITESPTLVLPTTTATPSPSQTPLPSQSPMIKNSLFDTHNIIIIISYDETATSTVVTRLLQIMQQITNHTCAVSNTTTNDTTATSITVFICESDANILLDALQDELEQSIHQQFSNETAIELLQLRQNSYPLSTTMFSQTSETTSISTTSMDYEVLMWTVKLIALQIFLCCVLCICIFTLKLRTKQLTVEKEKVSRLRSRMMRHSTSVAFPTTGSIGTRDADGSMTPDLSTLYLNGTFGSKKSIALLPLMSNTVESNVSSAVSTVDTVGTAESVGWMTVLESEAIHHVPQESLTLRIEEDELRPLRCSLGTPAVRIVSEGNTSSVDFPAIPLYTQRQRPRGPMSIAAHSNDSSVGHTSITRTKTITHSPTYSPTVTFSGPKYVANSRNARNSPIM